MGARSPRSNRARALLLSGLCLSLVGAGTAWAGEIVVSTGPERGSYHHIGERLKTELLVGHNEIIRVQQSAGSVENLQRLSDAASPVNVGLVQADVLGVYLISNPGFAERYAVLGDVGRECALLIGSAQSDVTSLAELKRRGGRIAVGSDDSGAKVTFSSMVRVAPSLGRLRPATVPSLEALLELKQAPRQGGLAAALVVQRPRRVSPAVEAVLEHPEAYRWLPIHETDVGNDALPDGRLLYSYERVAVGGVRGTGLEIDTLCTRGLLLAVKDKLTLEQRTLLSETLLTAGEGIIGRDE